jgi:hypothetical protein
MLDIRDILNGNIEEETRMKVKIGIQILNVLRFWSVILQVFGLT